MRSLKEALLNRPKNVEINTLWAEEYIRKNYQEFGNLTFEYENGVLKVNSDNIVIVSNKNITKLTDGFVWGEVKRRFICCNCTKLESLEGAPEYVSVGFDCSGCTKLKTLEGAPKLVDGYFNCNECEGLISLEGAPEKVTAGSFNCEHCINLKNLKGAPKFVKKSLICDYCYGLESLEGAPEYVGDYISCRGCKKIKSFKDFPRKKIIKK